MATVRNAWRNLGDKLTELRQNIGTVRDFNEGVAGGSSSATEDARSQLWKYREQQGLDEPPQIQEQIVRSSALDAIREVATAYLGPKSPLKDIGFSDDMMRHRQEQGMSIIDDPTFFDRRIDAARKLKGAATKGTLAQDFDDPSYPALNSQEYDEIIRDGAEDLRRLMREQSILKKIGRATGSVIGDISEDRTRSLWWLLNAPQAITSTIADTVVGGADPNLRTRRKIMPKDFERAVEQGLLRRVGDAPRRKTTRRDVVVDDTNPQAQQIIDEFGDYLDDPTTLNADNYEPAKPGVRRSYDPETKQHIYTQRRVSPSKIALFGLGGTALATNAGLGLIGTEDSGVPLLGRREGYGASAPSSEDARLTDNIGEEVITKYLLSRDGKLLPKREFLLERGDVSPEQYADYQAYSFDKNTDLNPFDDGRVNILNGLAKGSLTGIHGPEVQFLGQTLSFNEAIVPIMGALAGTAVGGLAPNIRQLRLRKHADRDRLNSQGRLMDYKEPKSIFGKIKANLPDVKRKTYNQEEDLVNPFIKSGSLMDKITKEYENRFTEINPVTQKRDMKASAHGLSMGIGAGAGLAAATGIGLAAEDQRRRDNFETWAAPGLNYDSYLSTKKDLLNTIKEAEKGMPPAEKASYKNKAEMSDVAKKRSLMEQMTEQQAMMNEMLSEEKQRRKAEQNLNTQQSILDQINALENT